MASLPPVINLRDIVDSDKSFVLEVVDTLIMLRGLEGHPTSIPLPPTPVNDYTSLTEDEIVSRIYFGYCAVVVPSNRSRLDRDLIVWKYLKHLVFLYCHRFYNYRPETSDHKWIKTIHNIEGGPYLEKYMPTSKLWQCRAVLHKSLLSLLCYLDQQLEDNPRQQLFGHYPKLLDLTKPTPQNLSLLDEAVTNMSTRLQEEKVWTHELNRTHQYHLWILHCRLHEEILQECQTLDVDFNALLRCIEEWPSLRPTPEQVSGKHITCSTTEPYPNWTFEAELRLRVTGISAL